MVRWNPTYKLQTTYKQRDPKHTYGAQTEDLSGFLSSSLLLMHEFGHAYQLLSDPTGYNKQMKDFGKALKKGTKEQKKAAKASGQKVSDQEAMAAAKEKLKDDGKIVLEETNVVAVENTVAMELRGKKCPEGLRWWYADNAKKKTAAKEISLKQGAVLQDFLEKHKLKPPKK